MCNQTGSSFPILDMIVIWFKFEIIKKGSMPSSRSFLNGYIILDASAMSAMKQIQELNITQREQNCHGLLVCYFMWVALIKNKK